MTYSTGPGGYGEQPQGAGGQGYGQPAPAYGAAPSAGRGLPFFLNIGVIAIGVVSFFLGFAPFVKVDETSGRSPFDAKTKSFSFFYSIFPSGVGTIALVALLAAALIAAFALLPKQEPHDAVVAGLSVTGFVSLLFLLFGIGDGFSAGIGLILVLVTSFLQAGAAVVGLLLGSGVIKPPAPRQAQYGGYYGQPGYGQPQQQYYGGAPGAPGAPTYQAPPSQPVPPPSQPQGPPPSQPQPPQNPW
jgi:hypothetical protein